MSLDILGTIEPTTFDDRVKCIEGLCQQTESLDVSLIVPAIVTQLADKRLSILSKSFDLLDHLKPRIQDHLTTELVDACFHLLLSPFPSVSSRAHAFLSHFIPNITTNYALSCVKHVEKVKYHPDVQVRKRSLFYVKHVVTDTFEPEARDRIKIAMNTFQLDDNPEVQEEAKEILSLLSVPCNNKKRKIDALASPSHSSSPKASPARKMPRLSSTPLAMKRDPLALLVEDSTPSPSARRQIIFSAEKDKGNNSDQTCSMSEEPDELKEVPSVSDVITTEVEEAPSESAVNVEEEKSVSTEPEREAAVEVVTSVVAAVEEKAEDTEEKTDAVNVIEEEPMQEEECKTDRLTVEVSKAPSTPAKRLVDSRDADKENCEPLNVMTNPTLIDSNEELELLLQRQSVCFSPLSMTSAWKSIEEELEQISSTSSTRPSAPPLPTTPTSVRNRKEHIFRYSEEDLAVIREEMAFQAQKEARILQKEVEELENRCSTLQEENTDLKATVEECLKTMNNIMEGNKELREFKDKYASLLTDHYKQKKAFEELQMLFEEARTVTDNLKENERTLKAALSAAQSDVEVYSEKFREIKSHAEKKLAMANTQIKTLNEELQKEIDTNQGLRTKISELGKHNQQNDMIIVRLQEENKNLQLRLSKFSGLSTTSEGDRAELQEKNKALEQQVSRLTLELDHTKERLEVVTAAIGSSDGAKAQEKIKSLEAQLVDKDKQYTELLQLCDDLFAQVEKERAKRGAS